MPVKSKSTFDKADKLHGLPSNLKSQILKRFVFNDKKNVTIFNPRSIRVRVGGTPKSRVSRAKSSGLLIQNCLDYK